MKKILIVEDNEDMRFLYNRLFRRESEIELTESDTGEAALEIVPRIRPDLVIVDISLPAMSGLELTRELRRSYPTLKILVVTGHEESRYYSKAKECGADDLVSKDIGKKLIDKCKAMLGIV